MMGSPGYPAERYTYAYQSGSLTYGHESRVGTCSSIRSSCRPSSLRPWFGSRAPDLSSRSVSLRCTDAARIHVHSFVRHRDALVGWDTGRSTSRVGTKGDPTCHPVQWSIPCGVVVWPLLHDSRACCWRMKTIHQCHSLRDDR